MTILTALILLFALMGLLIAAVVLISFKLNEEAEENEAFRQWYIDNKDRL